MTNVNRLKELNDTVTDIDHELADLRNPDKYKDMSQAERETRIQEKEKQRANALENFETLQTTVKGQLDKEIDDRQFNTAPDSEIAKWIKMETNNLDQFMAQKGEKSGEVVYRKLDAAEGEVRTNTNTSRVEVWDSKTNTWVDKKDAVYTVAIKEPLMESDGAGGSVPVKDKYGNQVQGVSQTYQALYEDGKWFYNKKKEDGTTERVEFKPDDNRMISSGHGFYVKNEAGILEQSKKYFWQGRELMQREDDGTVSLVTRNDGREITYEDRTIRNAVESGITEKEMTEYIKTGNFSEEVNRRSEEKEEARAKKEAKAVTPEDKRMMQRIIDTTITGGQIKGIKAQTTKMTTPIKDAQGKDIPGKTEEHDVVTLYGQNDPAAGKEHLDRYLDLKKEAEAKLKDYYDPKTSPEKKEELERELGFAGDTAAKESLASLEEYKRVLQDTDTQLAVHIAKGTVQKKADGTGYEPAPSVTGWDKEIVQDLLNKKQNAQEIINLQISKLEKRSAENRQTKEQAEKIDKENKALQKIEVSDETEQLILGDVQQYLDVMKDAELKGLKGTGMIGANWKAVETGFADEADQFKPASMSMADAEAAKAYLGGSLTELEKEIRETRQARDALDPTLDKAKRDEAEAKLGGLMDYRDKLRRASGVLDKRITEGKETSRKKIEEADKKRQGAVTPEKTKPEESAQPPIDVNLGFAKAPDKVLDKALDSAGGVDSGSAGVSPVQPATTETRDTGVTTFGTALDKSFESAAEKKARYQQWKDAGLTWWQRTKGWAGISPKEEMDRLVKEQTKQKAGTPSTPSLTPSSTPSSAAPTTEATGKPVTPATPVLPSVEGLLFGSVLMHGKQPGGGLFPGADKTQPDVPTFQPPADWGAPPKLEIPPGKGAASPALPNLPPLALSPTDTHLAPKDKIDAEGKKEDVTLNAGTVHLNIQEANFKNGSVALTADGRGFGKDFSPKMLPS
jgi:hypothetical protein